MKNIATVLLGLLTMLGIADAQQTGYFQTNLVANTAGVANHTDAQLSNPWGISIIPGQPFWIANNNGGTSTLYDAQGSKDPLVVGIPTAHLNPCAQGCPTGTVSNTVTTDFAGGSFIFDTEDGIIANWTGQGNATVAFDNSASGAVYKGLALLTNGTGRFLLAANFNSGKVDVFDRTFHLTNLAGSFTDPNLPAGFAPHGIHVVGNTVFVLYAKQDGPKHDPVVGAGLGRVDAFDVNGNFVSTFASGGMLNAPWGFVTTPASFTPFSNAVLVGNFGDGTMSAFDRQGNVLGQVKDSADAAIVNPGLWDMVFGVAGTGDPNTLYFTAGGANQTSGLFAALVPAANAGSDFSLNFSTQSATIAPGGSSAITIGAAAVGAFNGPITLSCTAAAGLNCSFSPNVITPGSNAASSTLTIAAATTRPPQGYGMIATAVLPGFGLFGTFLTLKRRGRRYLQWILGLALITVAMGFTVACGSSNNHQTSTSNQATLMVTGTAGALRHSTPVTITIQ